MSKIILDYTVNKIDYCSELDGPYFPIRNNEPETVKYRRFGWIKTTEVHAKIG
jgi:hypothetical protein